MQRRFVVVALSGVLVLLAGVASAQHGGEADGPVEESDSLGIAQIPVDPPGGDEGEANAALGEAEGEAGLAAAEATLAEVEAFLGDLEDWVGCIQDAADAHAQQQANEDTRVEDDDFEAADECPDKPLNPNDSEGDTGEIEGREDNGGPDDDGDRGRPDDAGPPDDAGRPDDAGPDRGEND